MSKLHERSGANQADQPGRDERYQIQIRDVHKSFGVHHVLRGVDLDIERGRINIVAVSSFNR